MSEAGQAVYFRESDYAALWRRAGAFLIDVFVLFFVLSCMGVAGQLAVVPREVRAMPSGNEHERGEKQRAINKHMKPVQIPIVAGWIGLCAAYHIGLRRRVGGTIGYRFMRIRVVDCRGEPPAVRQLAGRMAWGLASLWPLGIGYLAILRSKRRQAFHDQWSSTWLVGRRARPAGAGRIASFARMLGPFMLMYDDVEPVEEAGAEEAG